MGNTLVIGYGGQGCSCASAYSLRYSLPALLLGSSIPEDEREGVFQSSLDLTQDDALNEARVTNALANYRNVLFISSLGGDSFKGFYDLISKCARQMKIQFVGLCTIPFSFETERRSRALKMISDFKDLEETLFLIDLQKTINEVSLSSSYTDYIQKTEVFLVDILHIIITLLEFCPFSSCCADHIYTLAVGSGSYITESANDAVKNVYFPIEKLSGKILICLDGPVNQFDKEQVFQAFSSRTGYLPEIVGKSGLGNDKAVLLIPISCQCE